MRPALIVIAKAPVAGRVKTRLSPPCTPAQAARLARAALADTFAACDAAAGARRRVVAVEGEPGGWIPGGWDVVAQRGDGLAERLAGAFADVGGPALAVGMDTPQVGAAQIEAGLAALARFDAVFGPATDGGYWAIGLREADPAVFAGVPMSRDDTGPGWRSWGCAPSTSRRCSTWTTSPMPARSPPRRRRAASPPRSPRSSRR
jgi:glycosyltransferase A (GT-A) superfamily protein (DUF2064 family)